MSIQDDNILINEVLKGKISSFGLLIDKYQKPVYNLIFNMVEDEDQAKDIVQDVFIKVYEKLESFNFKHKFFSWLYRIAINDTINFLKNRKKFETLTEQNEIQAEKTTNDHKEEQRRQLHAALRELRTDHRVLILLKYFFGLSYEEISDVMKIQEKMVKARLFMAREKLREVLIKNKFFEHD